MKIAGREWPKNIQGAVWGGVGLRMTPRGVAKFAQLYLDGGQHEGQQLVPADYVTLSTQPVVELSQPNRGYSLQWWINDEGDDRIYSGQGYGGQGMMIVPDKQLIVLGFQQYNLPPGESDRQWNRFFGQMFMPIYLSVD
ncbi:MAG: serine hydrolase [Bacteroidota bacterium]